MNDVSLSPSLVTRQCAALLVALSIALLSQGGILEAQSSRTPVSASARLVQVLPPDIAQRVLARIAAAQQQGLPGTALEQRALKFVAKGVNPAAIEMSIAEHANRMAQAKEALEAAPGHRPMGDEIDAGADAIRKGVDGAKVRALAMSAPSGRSLVVPLYVVGSLIDRGLPADSALQRVQDGLRARASDAVLEAMPNALPPQAAAGQSHRSAGTGRDMGSTKKHPAGAGDGARGGVRGGGAGAGGPPAGVPANPGQGQGKGKGGKPTIPPGHRP